MYWNTTSGDGTSGLEALLGPIHVLNLDFTFSYYLVLTSSRAYEISSYFHNLYEVSNFWTRLVLYQNAKAARRLARALQPISSPIPMRPYYLALISSGDLHEKELTCGFLNASIIP